LQIYGFAGGVVCGVVRLDVATIDPGALALARELRHKATYPDQYRISTIL